MSQHIITTDNNVIQLPTPTTTNPAHDNTKPPAGFKLQYFCTCGCGCTPDERMDDDCEIEGSIHEGPSTYLTNDTGCQVNSSWTPKDGIELRISSHGFDAQDKYVERAWTLEQAQQLPAMIQRVLDRIDEAGK
jgi:hypothetical protein